MKLSAGNMKLFVGKK